MNEIVDTFSNRLKYALTIRNMKPSELSEKTGIDKAKISSYMSGRYKAKQDGLVALSKVLNVSPVWLIGYDVPMLDDKNIINNNASPIADTPIKIPVLGKISAGLPILATENIEGYEFAPSSFIKEGFDYFYLKVDGDSMNLKFNNGDIVLVQKQDTLENDEIGVIMVNDEATVKKFKYENNMIILYPMSTNPEHTVQIYKVEQIKIIGKVISYQGKI